MKIDSSNIAAVYGNQTSRANAKNAPANVDKKESASVQDKVQLSSVATTNDSAKGIDNEKVAQLRARIASGDYQPNAEKIAAKILQTYKN